jgi:hypothetical protein
MTTAATSKQPKVLSAISVIQAEIGTIPKNGEMKFGGTQYNFVKNDDILAAVSEKLTESNVITRPRIISRVVENREIGANRTLPMISVEVEITYVSTEDGSEFVAGPFWGEGAGNDDKGLRKAVTQAQKIANLLTFNIATGEPDPDEFYGNSNPPASGMGAQQPQQTRTSASVTKAKADPTADAKRLQGQVKAAAGTLGWSGAQINAFAEPLVGKDFIGDPAKLQTVYDAMIAKAKEEQTNE